MTPQNRLLPLGIWIAVLAGCLIIILQTRFIADLSAFMPKMPNERQQVLVEQLRDGAIARLILIGIEGGNPNERARLSILLADALRKDPAFIGVQNGDSVTQNNDRAYFFNNRYLLSPAISEVRFTVDGLRAAIGNSLEVLSGDAGLILKKLLPRDPTGETLQILEQFVGESQPNSIDGAWASRDGSRALLLAQTSAAGSDLDAQSAAINVITSVFSQLPERVSNTRVVMTGTGVFSVSSRGTIESEVRTLASASTVLVICFLLLVYRSFTLLSLGLLPVVSGALVGIAAVSLGFGNVHGLTLGFGTTLIGEAVDYSIYFFVQKSGEEMDGYFWRTIRLGVLTSITGFAALLFSGFPGLSQLGLYSICGLIAAVLVTRYILPLLMPNAIAIRDLTDIGVILDLFVQRARALRWLLIPLLLGAATVIALHYGQIWNRQLSALSPVSKVDQQLDLELRSDIGAPDMRYLVTFTAKTEEDALQHAERLGVVMQGLVEKKVIGGFNSPAVVLPSVSSQLRRQHALPSEADAQRKLSEALSGMPLSPSRLGGFLTDIETARTRVPLIRADLAGTSAALLVDSLLVKREKDILVLMPLRATPEGPLAGQIPVAEVDAALNESGLSKVTVIDLLEETTAIFDSYLHEAMILSMLGFIAIIFILLVALKSLSRMLRIVIPLMLAVIFVVAGLLLGGTQLTILHLVGLLLVVAVGSNYALFFDSGAQPTGGNDRRQTQMSLLIANLTTVGTFGMLGISKVPVLSAVGTTVAAGAFIALVLSAILANANSDAAHN